MISYVYFMPVSALKFSKETIPHSSYLMQDGKIVLIEVVRKRRMKALDFLLEKGAKVDQPSKVSLEQTFRYGHESVHFFVQNGMTALMISACLGDIKAMEKLLNAKADKKYQNNVRLSHWYSVCVCVCVCV